MRTKLWLLRDVHKDLDGVNFEKIQLSDVKFIMDREKILNGGFDMIRGVYLELAIRFVSV